MINKVKKDDISSSRFTFLVMLVFGGLGLLSAFVLTIERFFLLENPQSSLSCDFSLVLSCSTVMQTPQSQVFGFPNMIIGLMAYAVVVTVAVAGIGSVKFPRWFLLAANVGYGLGAIFAYWLFFQSMYVIEVLCPWCLVVTFSTTLILASITHYNLRQNTLGLSKATSKRVRTFVDAGFDKLIVASWIVLLVALVFIKFGDALFL